MTHILDTMLVYMDKCVDQKGSLNLEVNLGNPLHVGEGPTLDLKLRADISRGSKQGYQWPNKKNCCPQKKKICLDYICDKVRQLLIYFSMSDKASSDNETKI